MNLQEKYSIAKDYENSYEKISKFLTENLTKMNYEVLFLKENNLSNLNNEFEKLKKFKKKIWNLKWKNYNINRENLINKILDNLNLINIFSSQNEVIIEKIENKIYILIYKIESIGQGVASVYETQPQTIKIVLKYIITEIN